jgi:hypothetical protein
MLRYRLLTATFLQLAWAIVAKQTRSFHHDASRLSALLDFKVYGRGWIPTLGPIILTPNHYYRRGYGIWNVIIALSSVISPEIHWITTSMLTFPGQRRGVFLRPLTHYFLSQVARIYSFTTMPPMPPDPSQVKERALAVRKVLKYINDVPSPVIVGLAPEGQDFPEGRLGWPPSGSGRFIYQLIKNGLLVAPVGVFEEGGCLVLNFGQAYRPEISTNLSSQDIDSEIGRSVMSHLASLIPPELRGEFSPASGYPPVIS